VRWSALVQWPGLVTQKGCPLVAVTVPVCTPFGGVGVDGDVDEGVGAGVGDDRVYRFGCVLSGEWVGGEDRLSDADGVDGLGGAVGHEDGGGGGEAVGFQHAVFGGVDDLLAVDEGFSARADSSRNLAYLCCLSGLRGEFQDAGVQNPMPVITSPTPGPLQLAFESWQRWKDRFPCRQLCIELMFGQRSFDQ
jgi:hypothetical protein